MSKSPFLLNLESHISETKQDKYAGKSGDVIDFLEGQDTLTDFASGNVVKYVTRYKKTQNKKDLLKAAHYIQILYERC